MQEESSRACTGCRGSTRAACSPPPARCPCGWVLGTHRAALQQQKRGWGRNGEAPTHRLPVLPAPSSLSPFHREGDAAPFALCFVSVRVCSTSNGARPRLRLLKECHQLWDSATPASQGLAACSGPHPAGCSCRETFTGLSAITRPQSRRMQPVPSPTCCPAALNPAAAGRSVLLALQGHPAASCAVMMKLPGKISKNYT